MTSGNKKLNFKHNSTIKLRKKGSMPSLVVLTLLRVMKAAAVEAENWRKTGLR